MSITVQEMATVHDYMLRQLPLAWEDSNRCNLVDGLERFIANRTREVFLYHTGPQQQPEDPGDSPLGHMVYVGRKVYVSPRYRIERVDPDAAIMPQQKLAQSQRHGQLLQALATIGQKQLQEALHGPDPTDEGLYQELEKLGSAEILRVEGPLAELDWNGFEYGS